MPRRRLSSTQRRNVFPTRPDHGALHLSGWRATDKHHIAPGPRRVRESPRTLICARAFTPSKLCPVISPDSELSRGS